MVNEISQVTKLTKQEIDEVNQFIMGVQKARGTYFNLSQMMIARESPYYFHLLYRKEGKLIGYMLLSSYDQKELEITTVFNGSQIEFKVMYDYVKRYGTEKKFENCLFVTDHQDSLMVELLKKLEVTYSFSEYQLNFDQQNLSTFKKSNGIHLSNGNEEDREIIVRLNEERFDNQEITAEELAEVELEGIKIARLNGEVVGKLKIYDYQGEIGIYGFIMAPHLRGQGIGRQLLEAAITASYRNKLDKLYLEVESNNAPALHLYQSMGFVIEAKFDYYKDNYLT